MVDQETFSRRPAALAGYCARLKAFQSIPEAEFLREPAVHDLAERYLHLAVEAALDLGNHCIATQNLRTPATNADAFLGRIPQFTGAPFRELAGHPARAGGSESADRLGAGEAAMRHCPRTAKQPEYPAAAAARICVDCGLWRN